MNAATAGSVKNCPIERLCSSSVDARRAAESSEMVGSRSNGGLAGECSAGGGQNLAALHYRLPTSEYINGTSGTPSGAVHRLPGSRAMGSCTLQPLL